MRPLEGFDMGVKRKWLLDTFDMLDMSSNLAVSVYDSALCFLSAHMFGDRSQQLGLHCLDFACSAMAAGRLDTELLFRREIAVISSPFL